MSKIMRQMQEEARASRAKASTTQSPSEEGRVRISTGWNLQQILDQARAASRTRPQWIIVDDLDEPIYKSLEDAVTNKKAVFEKMMRSPNKLFGELTQRQKDYWGAK